MSTVIRWFDSPTGGIQVGSGTPFVTPFACSTKTYYAEEFNTITGCFSVARSSIVVTPTAAVAINAGLDTVLCNLAGPATLTATSANMNYVYTWSPSTD
ncbi:MAG: hypothetical protein IPP29_22955 [Bacteroidetes bacterium]|nr:hypothetical protein [Bacteroidota bacterium]